MDRERIEERIVERGREFFARMGDERPSIFNKNWWTGKVMDWCMRDEQFKVQLFRFVDVLPTLTTSDLLNRHVAEYFSRSEHVPAFMKWGIKGASVGGRLGKAIVGRTIRRNIEGMARQFIVGAAPDEAAAKLTALREADFAFTVDVLGEAVISEPESDQYLAGYDRLLAALAAAQETWSPLGGGEGVLDWGASPRINVSVKPSALDPQARPADFEGTVTRMLQRLRPPYRTVVAAGGFLCIDMESRAYKSITIELYRRLRSDPEFRDYPHLGLALQLYLTEGERDVDDLLAWARREGLSISIRLIKGAYWDYEIIHARQCGWEPPVFTVKAATDAAFERAAESILRNHDICHLACGSHNVRSVCAILELADALGVPPDRYEFQALYGMAEPFRKALLGVTGRTRLYCPQGELVPGMAYLIRRLMENSANESFLRQTFVEGVEMDRLLGAPAATLKQAEADKPAPTQETPPPGVLPPFRNQPFADFAQADVREAFVEAVASVRSKLARSIPLVIASQEVTTDEVAESVNPARPSEVVARVSQATGEHVEAAIASASEAFGAWRDTPPRDRAAFLVRAAEAARGRMVELAAWQVLEAGKQWDQAYNDVAEAVDFLEYYAREMIRLGRLARLGHLPGEVNESFYQPKGIASVIAPWNFPLAISCGMCAAALVAGNCVLYKPSSQTPAVGYGLAEIFRDAGLPSGVFHFLPGRGSVIGDLLVDHPKISLIAFTGSMEVGLRIVERAGRTDPDQVNVKKVIAEMGGKNAILIDDDADLDEAVPEVITSAFGYQGQKCSACSRVIVLDAAYDRLVERLVDAARSMRIGPGEDPGNVMGPVIDAAAQRKILEYVDLAEREGRLLHKGDVPEDGFYVPPTIVGDICPEHRIAQEEVFGPVLAVMRATDFDEAIAWANSTRFALTGAIFSRSPDHIDRCRREFRVGNLYINRGSAGAMVARQPFGGFKMSGLGSKAGGGDYLLHFMDPRVVTENTLRRGFAPVESEDEWV